MRPHQPCALWCGREKLKMFDVTDQSCRGVWETGGQQRFPEILVLKPQAFPLAESPPPEVAVYTLLVM